LPPHFHVLRHSKTALSTCGGELQLHA
jgi:hypothetical protein